MGVVSRMPSPPPPQSFRSTHMKPNTWEAEADRSLWFKANWGYIGRPPSENTALGEAELLLERNLCYLTFSGQVTQPCESQGHQVRSLGNGCGWHLCTVKGREFSDPGQSPTWGRRLETRADVDGVVLPSPAEGQHR